MEHNATNHDESIKPLSRKEVKTEMRRRRGYRSWASYGRVIRKHRSTVMALADGKIGGDLRDKFLAHFKFTENEIPLRTITALKERQQGEAA